MCTIRVFSSTEHAFLVNSFLIETPAGLIVVDTQFLVSSAMQLCAAIRATGKPPIAVIITHPHPDHFNGTQEIDREWPGLPIYATQATIDGIRSIESAKRAAWTPVYGSDYPEGTVLPNRVVRSGEVLEIGGETLSIDDLGAGEAGDVTVVHLPRHEKLLASDLLYNRVHPWLSEGRTAQWLSQIDRVRDRYAGVGEVYAGHGAMGTLECLSNQGVYIRNFRQWVFEGVDDLAHPTTAEKAAIALKVHERYPDFPLRMLVEMNIDGVANELASDASAQQLASS